MKRLAMKPRPDWKEKLEAKGCFYHTPDNEVYWQDDVAYELTSGEVNKLETAGNELHSMCLELADSIVTKGDYQAYKFPDVVIQLIEESWNADEWELMGRFDLGYDGYDGTNIKLFEYNADTPTTLPEASVWQWHVLEDRNWPDQFNSIHEALVERWKRIVPLNSDLVHFTTADASHEDWGNLHYMMECAIEAGHQACSINIDKLGWSERHQGFTDLSDRIITRLFKLYPWEWLMRESFGWNVSKSGCRFIEPAWKMLLSNKTLLPLLWRRFPGHPLLLEAHMCNGSVEQVTGGDWIRKPVLGREGQNISHLGKDVEINPEYDTHGYVIQKKFDVPAFSGQYPTMGVWIIGDEARGLGIREDVQDIATNASRFVPHYFK